MAMDNIVFLEPNKIDSEPFTTSDVIAEFAGVKHHAMQVLIQKYETDLKEFGKVSFEMKAVKRSGERGIKYLKNYHLNEQQATLLITYLKNTERVRAFKKELVRQFYAMRQELLKRQTGRAELKTIRRELTDVIKEQEPDDPWAYKKYTDLAYKSSIGKNAAQLRRERDAPKKAKAVDYLTSDEIAAVAKRQNQIAVLSITRPAALNALNSETLDELNVCLGEIEKNDDIKVVILTGGPDKKGNEFKSFVAGADIAEMVNFTAPEARAFGIKASEPFFKLQNMRQVTIAAINGFALGGGCEIAMSCDIRIASDNAVFAQPECGLGIIPGFGGTQRLARLVGMGRAKEMIFTCDNVDANEAYRIGLVNKVVAKEELMQTAKDMAAKIISKGRYAVSVAKAAINNGYDMDIRNAVEMEANLFGVVNDTNDKKEGMGAFLEKRAANLTDF